MINDWVNDIISHSGDKRMCLPPQFDFIDHLQATSLNRWPSCQEVNFLSVTSVSRSCQQLFFFPLMFTLCITSPVFKLISHGHILVSLQRTLLWLCLFRRGPWNELILTCSFFCFRSSRYEQKENKISFQPKNYSTQFETNRPKSQTKTKKQQNSHLFIGFYTQITPKTWIFCSALLLFSVEQQGIHSSSRILSMTWSMKQRTAGCLGS